jgi:TonB family protein
VPARVVVYATFDAEGRFENSRIIRGADAQIDQAILAALRSWEFLPAFAEGEPVLVEALLGIPLR